MIECINLSKYYKMPNKRVEALKNINLKIDDGEFVSIVGKSGSGKSTLMNIIGCLDVLSEGTYLINGKDASHLKQSQLADLRNRYIGFVFQGFNLIPTLNAYENVELSLVFKGVGRSERKKLVTAALESVDMLKRKDHLPSELSGGQNQRIAIARAIVSNPNVILADEPTGSLDKKTGMEILSLLMSLNDMGKTVVIVTHDDNVASAADRKILINDGRI